MGHCGVVVGGLVYGACCGCWAKSYLWFKRSLVYGSIEVLSMVGAWSWASLIYGMRAIVVGSIRIGLVYAMVIQQVNMI